MSWLRDLIEALLKPPSRPKPAPVTPPVPAPPPLTPEPTPTPHPPVASGIPEQLLAAHNRERAAEGLAPLSIEPRLQGAAQAHADVMARVGVMAHSGIGDGDLSDRLAASGYRASRAGENVAWNQRDVPTVMSAWMNSPGHRANVMGKFHHVGLALARGAQGDPYWSALFGTPTGVPAGAPSVMVVVGAPSRSAMAAPGRDSRMAVQSSASSTVIALRHPSAG